MADDSGNDDPNPSNYGLMASAKVMSDAVMGKETDAGKIAGAAADILGAAAAYGIVDEKAGVDNCMDLQAENYLRQYESTLTTTTTATTTTTDASGNKTTTTTITAAPDDGK